MKSLRYIFKPCNYRTSNSEKDYKTPIKEILASSSLAYLLSPFRSKRLLIKIIWTLFILVFLFGSIYYVILNVLDFLEYETTTSIYEIYEKEAEFPTISFCETQNRDFNIKILYLWFQNVNLIEDWQNHIESYSDSEYGRCYRFNSGLNMSNHSIPIKKSIRGGLDDGLWLNFYYNRILDSNSPIIYMHNVTDKPETIYHKGKYISSGSFNYFIMKRIYDQKLDLPYNNCFKNVSESDYNQTIIDLMKFKKRKYTRKECLNLCINYKYRELYPLFKNLDKDIFKLIEQYDSIEIFVKDSSNNEICLSTYCPLECNLFSLQIDKDSIEEKATGNIRLNLSLPIYAGFNTYENVTRTFFAIRVYYDELKYTLIKQHPKIELFGLISNIGGTLGLFLGFSFISILEIIEVLAELVYIKLNNQ